MMESKGNRRTGSTEEAPPRQAAAKAPATAPAASNDANEKRLRMIVESAPVGIMLASPSGQVIAANRAWLSLCGLGEGQTLVGQPARSMVPSDSREQFDVFLENASKGDTGCQEFGLVLANGTSRRVEIRGVPLRRADGAAVVLTSMWDVTARQGGTVDLVDVQARQDALVNEITTLQEALKAAEQARRATEVDAQYRLEAVTAELRNEQDQVREEATRELSTLREALKAAEQAHQTSEADAQGRVEGLTTELRGQLDRTREEATQELAALEAALATMQEEHQVALSRAEAEMQALRLERDRREEALQGNLDRQNTAMAALREEHQTALVKAAGAAAEAQARIVERDRREEALQSNLERQKAALAALQGEHRTALAQAAQAAAEAQSLGAERDRREESLQNDLNQQTAATTTAQEERDRLSKTVQELNASYAQLVRAKASERQELEAALAVEHERVTQLLQERDELRGELTVLLRLVKETSDQAQTVLDKQRTLRLVTSSSPGEAANGSPEGTLQAAANGTTGEGGSWQI